jgi:exportin-2 (importin alpha re-exporter)
MFPLEYIPYVLQIVAQMLELHTNNSIPPLYDNLFPLLITPLVWQQKGSIPALVRLMKAYLAKDVSSIVANGHLPQILGVVQQRLIPSKLNDHHGVDLLEAIFTYVPVSEVRADQIMLTLLSRLQTTRTDKFAMEFVLFLCYSMALGVNGVRPDFIVNVVESIQPGYVSAPGGQSIVTEVFDSPLHPRLWGNLVKNVAIPQVALVRIKDRKLVAVGLTRLLTDSETMLAPSNVDAWCAEPSHRPIHAHVFFPFMQGANSCRTSRTHRAGCRGETLFSRRANRPVRNRPRRAKYRLSGSVYETRGF